jgi:hypothetical protein
MEHAEDLIIIILIIIIQYRNLVRLRDGEEVVLCRNINKLKKKKMSGNSKLFDFAQHLNETRDSDTAP